MKTRLLAIFVVAVMVGLGACGGGDNPEPEKPKSSAKEITKVVVGTQEYQKEGDAAFKWNYPKSDPGEWVTEPSWPATIQITHTGVSISPTVNTITLNTQTGAGVEYTVTAEDGSTKKFTIRATRQADL